MKSFLALALLGVLSTSAIAEDFLGEETGEESEAIQSEPEPASEIPFANSHEWREGRWGIDSSYSVCRTMQYESDDEGLRNFNLDFDPDDKEVGLAVGHLFYSEFEEGKIVRGTISFDEGEPKKFKFKIDGAPLSGYIGIIYTNLSRTNVRYLLKAKTMHIKIEGAKPVDILLNGFDRVTKVLEYCFEKIKTEKAQQ